MRKSVIATVTAVALVMALAGARSASALQWSPQNTQLTGYSNGAMNFRSFAGYYWQCQESTFTGKTTGSAIVAAAAGLRFSGCFGYNASLISITPAGTWSVNAKSTTTASLSANTSPSGGTVLTISWGGCNVTAKGPVEASGLQWSNTTHRLTLPKGTTIPLESQGGLCSLFGSSIEIEGSYAFPSVLTVIP
jgi:hypothetical protein